VHSIDGGMSRRERMKQRIITGAILLTLVAWPSVGFTQSSGSGCPGIFGPLRTKAGFQQLAVSTVAVSLTVPSGARMAVAKVETNAIRWRDDGTLPTASAGFPQAVNDVILICDSSLSAIRFIRQSGDATVNVSYYGN
jgi:hypothetical protein